MGSCASVHKGTPGSAMKVGVSPLRSKSDKLVIPESPIKDKQQLPTSHPAPIKTFDDFGSKEEAFFDSQPWLESDCEDDFFSVNGDFTPSRGNTPVHHSFPMGIPTARKMPFEDKHPSTITTSPTGKKKRLSELFRESLGENQDAADSPSSGNRNGTNGKIDLRTAMLDLPPKSSNATPYISGTNSVCSSERTANGEALLERDKSIKSAQCCLPSLISCRSFSERKKKVSVSLSLSPSRNPAIAVEGKA